jgi:hypothetical protein
MSKTKKLLQILALLVLTGLLIPGAGQAETIIWVSGNIQDSTGVDWDQHFVDVLESAGYIVDRANDTMAIISPAVALTIEQLDILESYDLIIVSRSTTSGSYNDPNGWNSVAKPLICTTDYLSRTSRWNWIGSDAMIGIQNAGNSGCPPFRAEIPDHPIFTGVTLDADNLVHALDGSAGSGNTSLHNFADAGDDAVIIATTVSDSADAVEGAVAIVYWPFDVPFWAGTDQYAGAPRLLFQCGARESTVGNLAHGQGMYNLTPDGEKMFLNAVAWMLGKEVGVANNPTVAPTAYNLAQNYPNPFNPQTTISFALPTATAVSIRIYDTLGREVSTLTDQQYAAGTHHVIWNGLDDSGRMMESGLYLYKLEAGSFTQTKKMMLIK